MASLEQFLQQVEARLAAARHEPTWQAAQTAEFMEQIAPRRRRFEEIAPRLVRTIIRPHMQSLASFFPNAKLDRAEHDDRCAYWFGYCDRFPANTRVEIAVEHDVTIEHLIVSYELHIMPVFFKFDAHDKLDLPLDGTDDQKIADWIQAKLRAFLDTYLQLDRGADDFENEVAVDPVCGMRISRSSDVVTTDYRGHPYFFCSEDCRRRFAEDPLRYVRFEPG